MSKFLGDIGESGSGSEKDLQRLVFAEIEDSQCNVTGWRYRHQTSDLGTESIILFDTFPEVLSVGLREMSKFTKQSQSTELHLETVQDNLLEAVGSLTLAHHLLENTGLSKRYSVLFTAVCDALNATTATIEHCGDSPDV